MKWFLTGVTLIGIGTFTYFAIMFTGPRMRVQQHIRAYQRVMPLPPEGIVPVEQDRYALPAARQAAGIRNPVADNQDNRDRGKVYYGYYCIFRSEEHTSELQS